MSFKRDGDDQSQLNLLKKRRVSDLLADDIPEDEAYLMRSGRYACTVCHYRPVFDTIATLLVHRSGKKHLILLLLPDRCACTVCHYRPVFDTIATLLVHRSGKKHLNSLKTYYAKRRDLMREVEKRQQIQYLRNEEEGGVIPEKVEDAAPLVTKTRKATHHALLTSAPYKGYKSTSVTVQEHKNSEKKRSLFQRAFGNSGQRNQGDIGLPSATQTRALPGNGGSSIICKSQEASCVNDTRDKASVGPDSNVAEDVCQQRNKNQSDDSFNSRASVVPLTLTEKRQPATSQLKPYIPKNQRNRQHQTGKFRQSKTTIVPAPVVENVDVPKEPLYFKSNDVSQQNVAKPDEGGLKQTVSIPSRNGPIHVKKAKKHSRHPKAPSKDLKDAKCREREQYFKMTSSGWKSDWHGGWVKDEEVEFDSDEDEPLPQIS